MASGFTKGNGLLLLDRLSGIFFAGLGLLLYFVIIPEQTEALDYGWMRPQSVPNACAHLLLFLGIAQAAFPRGNIFIDWREMLKACVFAAIMAIAIWLMTQFGYLLAVPIFAGCLMLLVGERRPSWLIGGVILLPLAIWLIVVPLLGRPLP